MPSGRPAGGPNGRRIIYDRITVAIPIEQADIIRKKAKLAGVSLSKYMADLALNDALGDNRQEVKND